MIIWTLVARLVRLIMDIIFLSGQRRRQRAELERALRAEAALADINRTPTRAPRARRKRT